MVRFALPALVAVLFFSCSGPAPSASQNPDLPTPTGQKSTSPSDSTRLVTSSLEEYYDPTFTALPMKSSWVLDRMNGMELAEAELRGEVPTLTIDLENEKASGNAGCNRYNASVKLGGGNAINFGHIISTKMACQSQSIENAYLEILNYGLLQYHHSPSKLVIKREVRGRRTELEFKPAR